MSVYPIFADIPGSFLRWKLELFLSQICNSLSLPARNFTVVKYSGVISSSLRISLCLIILSLSPFLFFPSLIWLNSRVLWIQDKMSVKSVPTSAKLPAFVKIRPCGYIAKKIEYSSAYVSWRLFTLIRVLRFPIGDANFFPFHKILFCLLYLFLGEPFLYIILIVLSTN